MQIVVFNSFVNVCCQKMLHRTLVLSSSYLLKAHRKHLLQKWRCLRLGCEKAGLGGETSWQGRGDEAQVKWTGSLSSGKVSVHHSPDNLLLETCFWYVMLLNLYFLVQCSCSSSEPTPEAISVHVRWVAVTRVRWGQTEVVRSTFTLHYVNQELPSAFLLQSHTFHI